MFLRTGRCLLAKAAESSMGADIAELDLSQIQELAQNVLAFYELRKNMENYVDRIMEEMAPNVRTVAGALLGARLIAIAGSLQNLAMRPASTIQVLGAEKALFRSLKTGARPPKHGLIFQHTLLHDAKRWQRGKIARVIAGKLAIAARADAFGGNYIGERLKAEIIKRIEEIHVKYKEPPAPKEAKPRQERGGRPPFRSAGKTAANVHLDLLRKAANDPLDHRHKLDRQLKAPSDLKVKNAHTDRHHKAERQIKAASVHLDHRNRAAAEGDHLGITVGIAQG